MEAVAQFSDDITRHRNLSFLLPFQMCSRHNLRIIFLYLLCMYHKSSGTRKWPNMQTSNYTQNGDIMIGVALNIHERHASDACSNILRELAEIERTEVAAFAINEVNDGNLLPNISLGFTIVDTCSKDLTAQALTLRFINAKGKNNNSCPFGKDVIEDMSVIGVICAGGSRNTILMAPILAMYNIPLLSFTSSSPLLSDKNNFPYFLRIVPPDTYQAQAILAIMYHFGWTYFSVIYEEGSYGTELFRELERKTKNSGVCIRVGLKVKPSSTQTDYDYFAKQISLTPKARAIVIILLPVQAFQFMRTVKNKGLANNFFWIGTDSWGHNPEDFVHQGIDDIALGLIRTNFVTSQVSRFEDYFSKLTPNTVKNLWLEEYFSIKNNCGEPERIMNYSTCSAKNFGSSASYSTLSYASLIIDAVNVFARGVDYVLRKDCQQPIKEERLKCITGSKMLTAFRNLIFGGETGSVYFDKQQDGPAQYYITNYKIINNKLVDIIVGTWNGSCQNVTFNKPVTFRPKVITGGQEYPKSVCSDPCPSGYQKVIKKPKCCWECEKCKDNELTLSVNGTEKCERCPQSEEFIWPNANRTFCILIDQFHLSASHTAVFVMLFLCFVWLVTFVTTIVVFEFYRRNPALLSSRDGLSYVTLITIIVTNVTPVTLMLKPTYVTCVFNYISFQMRYSLIYGHILTKVWNMYQAFSGRDNAHIVNNDPKIFIGISITTILIQVSEFVRNKFAK